MCSVGLGYVGVISLRLFFSPFSKTRYVYKTRRCGLAGHTYVRRCIHRCDNFDCRYSRSANKKAGRFRSNNIYETSIFIPLPSPDITRPHSCVTLPFFVFIPQGTRVKCENSRIPGDPTRARFCALLRRRLVTLRVPCKSAKREFPRVTCLRGQEFTADSRPQKECTYGLRSTTP